MIAPFGSHKGYTYHRQAEAIHRLQQGKPLSNNDVAALAEGDLYVSDEEMKEADNTVFWLGIVFLLLPGIGILIYLHQTRQEKKMEIKGRSKSDQPRILSCSRDGDELHLWIHTAESKDNGWEIWIKADDIRNVVWPQL